VRFLPLSLPPSDFARSDAFPFFLSIDASLPSPRRVSHRHPPIEDHRSVHRIRALRAVLQFLMRVRCKNQHRLSGSSFLSVLAAMIERTDEDTTQIAKELFNMFAQQVCPPTGQTVRSLALFSSPSPTDCFPFLPPTCRAPGPPNSLPRRNASSRTRTHAGNPLTTSSKLPPGTGSTRCVPPSASLSHPTDSLFHAALGSQRVRRTFEPYGRTLSGTKLADHAGVLGSEDPR
jgi:hypothetical protein